MSPSSLPNTTTTNDGSLSWTQVPPPPPPPPPPNTINALGLSLLDENEDDDDDGAALAAAQLDAPLSSKQMTTASLDVVDQDSHSTNNMYNDLLIQTKQWQMELEMTRDEIYWCQVQNCHSMDTLYMIDNVTATTTTEMTTTMSGGNGDHFA